MNIANSVALYLPSFNPVHAHYEMEKDRLALAAFRANPPAFLTVPAKRRK